MTTIKTKLGRFARPLQYSVTALVLLTVCPSRIPAQVNHSQMGTAEQHEMDLDATATTNQQTLVKVVRDATERFKDVKVAEAAGYALQFGCVAGDTSGAMGLHYVNGTLVNSGILDPTRPQIVIYEPTPEGGLRLIGADFLVIADTWNASHSGPPEMMGQLFHLFTSPNRFGLPAFYTLHVWAWKPNPNGAFVNWHPDVSCRTFTGK
jgi:hypothetical protein